MQGVTVVIVEDDISTLEVLSMIVEEMGATVKGTFQNYEEALTFLKATKPDLLLADIDLGDRLTGLDLVEHLEDPPMTIFITSFTQREMVGRAKQLEPAAYLTKPFKKEDVAIAIEMAVFKNEPEEPDADPITALNDSLFVRHKNLFVRLRFSDIKWLKADGAYTEIKSKDKKYMVRNLLKKVEGHLPNDIFLRVHRSYLVNLNAIDAINTKVIHIDSDEIPISRNTQNDIITRINVLKTSED